MHQASPSPLEKVAFCVSKMTDEVFVQYYLTRWLRQSALSKGEGLGMSNQIHLFADGFG